MTLVRWKRIGLVRELKNPWWTYRSDEVELPSGKKGEYHYVHTNGSSMVIPVLDGGHVVLVRQYRYLCDRESLEFPCGSIKDGGTHEETARLELAEEAGYKTNSLVAVGEFNPYNGVTDEMCRVFVARKLESVSSTPDETEEFERLFLTPYEIQESIRRGEIWDGMTLAAWILAHKAVQQ
jgi:ADP-ribose pyrophosphatase